VCRPREPGGHRREPAAIFWRRRFHTDFDASTWTADASKSDKDESVAALDDFRKWLIREAA
jgi:hypothetical protein